jgi:hypothetical protein
LIGGGSLFIHPNGTHKKFYVRLNIYGGAPQNRKVYALRLIADPLKGSYAKEAYDFHDLTRAELGRFFLPNDPEYTFAKYGREEAIDWSVKRFGEKPEWRLCKSAEEYRELLIEGYKWLDRLPLGDDRKRL